MLKRKSAFLLDVGPMKAQEIITLLDPERQREPTAAHKHKLANMMVRGDYLTGHIVIACFPGGTKCIANGQHSLMAVIESGSTQHFLIEEYHCDTEDDYARLFMAYDTEERRRSWRESSTAWSRANRIAASATSVNEFRSGLEYMFVAHGEKMPDRTRYARFDVVKHHDHAMQLFTHLKSIAVDSNLVKRAPTVAAIIGTVQVDMDDAREFWEEVFTGKWRVSNVSEFYPPYRLHNYLRDVKVMTGSGSKRTLGVRSGQYGTQFDVYCACVRCWNSWVRNEELKCMRGSIKGKTPKFLRRLNEDAMWREGDDPRAGVRAA